MNRRMLVDLDALVRNYDVLRSRVAPAMCAAVVKADAYGIGMAAVASALSAAGCKVFFVATADEGILLRGSLPDSTIYVLEGADRHTATELAVRNLIPVLNTPAQAHAWAGQASTGRARCVLHVDSGMTRLGLRLADLSTLAGNEMVLPQLSVDYLMTHLACADEPGNEYNARQLSLFAQAANLFPDTPTSIANSSGVFLDTRYHGDLVRAGVALFGANPRPGRSNCMQEVVRVQGRIIQIRDVDAAAGVGYGATADVAPPRRLATVAFGYADGYPRSLSNCGVALIGGARVHVVGRVSMDSLVVDISALGTVAEGDWATLAGGGIDLDEVAVAAGTISYELLTGMGSRVTRIYRNVRQKLQKQ